MFLHRLSKYLYSKLGMRLPARGHSAAQSDPTQGSADHGHAQPDQTGSYDAQVDNYLDEALDETFPASDPVAVTPPPRRHRVDPDRKQT